MKFYPYEKGGWGGSYSHAKGGGGRKRFWSSLYALG